MTYDFFDFDGNRLHHVTLADALADKALYRVSVTNTIGTHEYINTGAGWKDLREV